MSKEVSTHRARRKRLDFTNLEELDERAGEVLPHMVRLVLWTACGMVSVARAL